MNKGVFISCAVTGDDNKVDGSPYCPLTPKEIAAAAIGAAQEGAAIVRIRVRDPSTGALSDDTALYREVISQIRESKMDVIVNITCGSGAHISVSDDGRIDTAKTDFVTQETRMRHVIELCRSGHRPDTVTLNCSTFTHGDGNRTLVSPPDYVREGLRVLQNLGVKAELAVFDTGNLWFAKQLIDEGLVSAPAVIQLFTGTPYGTPTEAGHLVAMVNSLPSNCIWTSSAPHDMQMAWVAQVCPDSAATCAWALKTTFI